MDFLLPLLDLLRNITVAQEHGPGNPKGPRSILEAGGISEID
jgi:hypothetical protein